MTTPLIKLQSLMLIVCLSFSPVAGNLQPAPQVSQAVLTADELDTLLAPIALYPDPLLAQILPAASFVDQIDQAQRLLNGRVDENLIDAQDWDISVKAIAHYPTILSKMDQDSEWTAALGDAFVTQQADVEKSIQRLRQEARTSGALRSTPQQNVIVEQQVIRIEPAEPQVIYVPQYDPTLVWYSDVSTGAYIASNLISFGTGFAMGSWMNRDWHWYRGGPYYHGWVGGGWIGASRHYVNLHNNYYVNNRFRNIDVNRSITQRNFSNYRARLNQETARRKLPDHGASGARLKPGTGNLQGNRPNFNNARVPARRDYGRDQLKGFPGKAGGGALEGRQKPGVARPAPSINQNRPALSGGNRGNLAGPQGAGGHRSSGGGVHRGGGGAHRGGGGGHHRGGGGGRGGHR
jgi:hypothetical protein